MQYEFLVGEAPEVVDIVPQREPSRDLRRAVNFPANTGREATLEIWAIDAETGARDRDEPYATFELGADGGFRPVELETGTHYEYALSTDETPVTHHLYLQPYLRSSHLVRLLSSPPDGDTRANTNVGDDHAAVIAIRMREWHATGYADVLEISVDGGEPVDAITDFVGNGAIGLHIHDDAATPGQLDAGAAPLFRRPAVPERHRRLPPGIARRRRTITVTNLPRGDASDPQVLNVPNWPSSTHSISVVFTDWPVDSPE